MVNRVIHKKVLNLGVLNYVAVPKGTQFLDFQNQREQPAVWYLRDVNGALDMEERVLVIFGTGHPIMSNITLKDYIGTAQFQDGTLVFHCFEVER